MYNSVNNVKTLSLCENVNVYLCGAWLTCTPKQSRAVNNAVVTPVLTPVFLYHDHIWKHLTSTESVIKKKKKWAKPGKRLTFAVIYINFLNLKNTFK